MHFVKLIDFGRKMYRQELITLEYGKLHLHASIACTYKFGCGGGLWIGEVE